MRGSDGQTLLKIIRRSSVAMSMLCSLALLAEVSSEAGPPSGGPTPFRHQVWTRDNGLPSNDVRCLLQTRDGYLWVGTTSGLCRFDGIQFKVFDRLNTPGLSTDSCTALAEDLDGSVWVGTQDGLFSLTRGRVTRRFENAGLPSQRISALCVTRKGELWVGTDEGLGRLVADRFEIVPDVLSKVEANDHRIRFVKESSDGGIWHGTVQGVKCWRRGTGLQRVRIERRIADVEEHPWANDMAEDPQGCLWFTYKYPLEYDGANWIVLEDDKWRKTPGVSEILFDRHGSPWVASDEGLVRYQNGIKDARGEVIALPGTPVNSLIEDREGNLWVGTAEAGVHQLCPLTVSALAEADVLKDQNIYAICPSVDGLWIGMENRLAHWGADGVRLVGLQPLNGRVRALHQDQTGRLWVGLGSMLACLEKGQLKRIDLPNETDEDRVRVIQSDHAGRVWFGWTKGLLLWENGQIVQPFAERDSLRGDILSVQVDHEGRLWVGTDGHGLSCLTGEKSSTWTTRDGLVHNSVTALHCDESGGVWIGTRGRLNWLKQGKIFAFKKEQGSAENAVYEIVADDSGYFWLTSDSGLFRIQRAQLEAVANGTAPRIMAMKCDELDGLPSGVMNAQKSKPSTCKLADGRICIATIKGVGLLAPKDIPPEEESPPIVIEEVVMDEELLFQDGVTLAHGSKEARAFTGQSSDSPRFTLPPGRGHVLKIVFTANSFSSPAKIRFQHRLVGHEEGWIEGGLERTAYYTSLRPGEYEFQVRACNRHGVWDRAGASFGISIAPFFWQIRWFQAAAGASFFGLLFAVVGWRVQRMRRTNEAENTLALTHERQRIARDVHDDIGARLTQISLLSELTAKPGNEQKDPRHNLSTLAREAVRTLDEIVWAAEPSKDTLDDLVTYVGDFAQEYLAASGLRLRIVCPRVLPDCPVKPETRHHIYLVIKEALANTVRHARATDVLLEMSFINDAFEVRISDNGQGFDSTSGGSSGNGLSNMRERTGKMGGEFSLQTHQGQGTVIRIRVKIPPGMAK